MIRKKIIMYLRKSRSDSQYETIEEVLAKHEAQLQDHMVRTTGKKIDEDCIAREVVSGETIADRPMMIKLLNEIEKGDVEAVVVIEPQRLTRGSFGEIDRIVNTLMYTDTKVITPVKTYDLNNKFDKKMFEQELLRGNDYLEYTKEILTRGKVKNATDGLFVGGKAPFGYNKVRIPKKGNTLVPNENAGIVRYIFEQYIDGIGTTTLARHLNEYGYKSDSGKLWTPSMIKNIIKNDVYAGYVSYGRRGMKKSMENGMIVKSRPVSDDYIRTKGLHEPIISEELFNKALEVGKSKGTRIRGDKQLQNPLAGIVKCKLCGNTMMRKKDYNVKGRSYLMCNNINCKCVSSNLKYVEDRIIELLKSELSDYKYYVANYEQEHDSNVSIIKKQLKKIDKELDAIQEDLQNSLIKYNRNKISDEEYAFLKEYATKEKYRLNGLKISLNEKLENDELDSRKRAIPIIENCLEKYYDLTPKGRNALLQAIIDKVEYSKTLKDGRWSKATRDDFTLDIFLKI